MVVCCHQWLSSVNCCCHLCILVCGLCLIVNVDCLLFVIGWHLGIWLSVLYLLVQCAVGCPICIWFLNVLLLSVLYLVVHCAFRCPACIGSSVCFGCQFCIWLSTMHSVVQSVFLFLQCALVVGFAFGCPRCI